MTFLSSWKLLSMMTWKLEFLRRIALKFNDWSKIKISKSKTLTFITWNFISSFTIANKRQFDIFHSQRLEFKWFLRVWLSCLSTAIGGDEWSKGGSYSPIMFLGFHLNHQLIKRFWDSFLATFGRYFFIIGLFVIISPFFDSFLLRASGL